MNSQRATLKTFTDAAADAVARAIVSVQREAQRDRAVWEADFRARVAELDARMASVAALERQLSDRLALLKDGEPGKNGADGKSVTVDDVLPALTERLVEHVDRVLGGWDRPKDGQSVSVADVEPVLREMVRDAVASVPPPRDGRDVDLEQVRAMVAEAVAALPPPKDGRDGEDADPDAIKAMVRDAVAAIPAPQDGRSVTVDDVAPLVDESVARAVAALPMPRDGVDGERGPEGRPGKLPVVRVWADGVHYEGDVVSLDGSAWQALRDTGKQPPHEDWIRIAARGADGASFTVRGTWSGDEQYRALDVVALNGASFVARQDDPGPCPGEGWQIMSMQGKAGRPGERGPQGERGERGEPGLPVVAAAVDGEGMLTLTNGDGSVVRCDMYPLLSKLSHGGD